MPVRAGCQSEPQYVINDQGVIHAVAPYTSRHVGVAACSRLRVSSMEASVVLWKRVFKVREANL